MRPLLYLVLLLATPPCFGGVPARHLGRPLPNGCLVHAMIYVAGLDPLIGTAQIVKVVGGGGVPHVIAVVSTPDGTRYGRDEDLGVFPLGDQSPQAAYDEARRRAIASRAFRSGVSNLSLREKDRSLSAALERLEAAGFEPERVDDVIVWRTGEIAYVYSPLRGCAEVHTCSRNLMRIAAAAVRYWTKRR